MNHEFFVVRNILYVKDYEFEDGTSKNKILIILANLEDESCIVQTLTTSQIKVPDSTVKHGCTNDELSALSFYMFEKAKKVGKTPKNQDFTFDKHTFVYFKDTIAKVPTLSYLKYFGQDNISCIGTLSEDEYKSLIACIAGSKLLKRSLKKYFEEIKKQLG